MRGFIGIDIETTGLDPEKDQILEIGAILFDEHLEEIESINLVGPDIVGIRRAKDLNLDNYVIKMHTASGLLQELSEIAPPDENLAMSGAMMDTLVSVISEWSERLGGRVPMLGSSVHFDRRFLEVHFPDLVTPFSHRNIDASSFIEYARVIDPLGCEKVLLNKRADATHRALDDIRSSAETIRLLSRVSWEVR